MPQVDPLILQLRAETRQLRNELRSTTVLVQNQLNEQTRSVLRLEDTVNRSTNRIGGAFGSMGQRINGILGGLALGVLVREMASIADQAKQLDAQLRLATNGFGTFAQGQEDVRRISEQTRGSLEATTKLYAGFLRASRETGRTQEDAARATQTFAEALKIGGAGTEEAASATLQFNQALQSGVLRGDEFNSIMEASPRIARLLADALGVPIGQLRAMAEQGEITADVLFRALTDRKFTAGIDAEFKQIPVTFGDAMQAIQNAAISSFGEFDKGGRFSDALVSFLSTGTDTFNGLTSRATQFGIDTRAVFDGLSNVFDPLQANGNAVFDALGIKIFSVREQISSLLHSIDDLRNAPADLQNAVNRFDRNLFGRQFTPDSARANSGDRFDRGTANSAARNSERIRVEQLSNRFGGIQGLSRFVSDPSRYNIFGQANITRPATVSAKSAQNAKDLEKHQGLLADLERLKVGASKQDLATINQKIAREKKIIANLEKGVGLSAATAAVGGAGRRGGKSDAEKQAEKDAKFMQTLRVSLSRSAADRDGLDELLAPSSERTAELGRQFRTVFGDVQKEFDDLFAGVEVYDRALEQSVEKRAEAEEQLRQQQSENIYTLAGILEDAFTLSSDQFWENFKRNGLRTLALIAAKALVTSFSKGGGGLGSLLGNLGKGIAPGDGANGLDAIIGGLFGSLPRFASGGSMTIGGNAGIDRNMLSLNGQPIARVSRGETLAVSPNTRAARGNGSLTVQQNINVDGRNSVTPAGFADEILRKANGYANEAAAASGREAVKAAPGAVQRARRFGTG